jgi:UDP-N-acetylglucosamine:LPS N-acetylglucosamine transferase
MKLLLVCNPGGHFSTMLGLKKFWSLHDREWATYYKCDTQQLEDREKVHWVIKQESREWGRALINLYHAFGIIQKSRPDLVVSTGASLAVPFILISKLFGIRSIFVESISRTKELSMSGKLVYYLADEIFVQWPDCTKSFPKAQFKGVVF